MRRCKNYIALLLLACVFLCVSCGGKEILGPGQAKPALDRSLTEVARQKAGKKLFNKAVLHKGSPDTERFYLVVFPDGIKFTVRDVRSETVGGEPGYRVNITYSKDNPTQSYSYYQELKKANGNLSWQCNYLLATENEKKIAKLKKGDTIKSRGWTKVVRVTARSDRYSVGTVIGSSVYHSKKLAMQAQELQK